MAGEDAFLAAVDLLCDTAGVLVVGLVPFTKRLNTGSVEAVPFAAAMARLREKHGKPLAIVVDSGLDYAAYRQAFRDAGLPVFDRVETALLGLQVLTGHNPLG